MDGEPRAGFGEHTLDEPAVHAAHHRGALGGEIGERAAVHHHFEPVDPRLEAALVEHPDPLTVVQSGIMARAFCMSSDASAEMPSPFRYHSLATRTYSWACLE